MKRVFVLSISIGILFFGTSFLYSENPIVDLNEEQQQNGWMPRELIELSNRLLELNAQIKAIEDYAPEKSPDFLNLEKINQLVGELEFNNRKFELLIKKYQLIEKELFKYLLDFSKKKKNIKMVGLINRYRKKGVNSLFEFQKTINEVALKIERIKRNISQIQMNAKAIALNSASKGKSIKSIDSITNTERIQRYEAKLKKFKKELVLEEDLLKEQNDKEIFQVSKIKEKRSEISELGLKSKKANNTVEKTIFLIKASVIKERLNGLEILKLNTIKARIYIIKTKIETLKEEIKKNINEQTLLEKIRKKEIKDNIIKSIIVILIVLLTVFFLIRLSKLIAKKVLKTIEKNDKFDAHKKQRYQTLSAVILSFTKILIWISAVFWTLGELDVDYGPFLVAAGGLSLAIGFGAQSLVKDIVTGFFLLIEEQFALGDYVEINGVGGTVEKISLRTIRFRSLNGTVHIVPNGNISMVANFSYKWSRAIVKIGVSYNEDTDHVFKALKEVCDAVYKNPDLKETFLEEPAIQGILAFNDSSVMFRITAKTKSGAQWGIEREINKAIKRVFDREKIEIPYNYVNVINVKE